MSVPSRRPVTSRMSRAPMNEVNRRITMTNYKGWRIFLRNGVYHVRQSAWVCRTFGTGTLFRSKHLATCKRWIDEGRS